MRKSGIDVKRKRGECTKQTRQENRRLATDSPHTGTGTKAKPACRKRLPRGFCRAHIAFGFAERSGFLRKPDREAGRDCLDAACIWAVTKYI
ncbi:hypothetical protein [Treponema endosymbiont of Eucomonympha sp.]|uniref:hypothetical protein n=1 Tax=Treponema endosymbiont of Eucomonympha sp. TaxID=1580831 RepID=UPI0007512073|nr:hypothetical protein [Treponema endosymbiont of Eucomonympha sp.]